jgi:hypothetical protein
MTNLLAGCSFSRTLWRDRIRCSRGFIPIWWPERTTWNGGMMSPLHPTEGAKGYLLVIMLMTWWIWMHRNVAIFNKRRLDFAHLLGTVKVETQQWQNRGGWVGGLLPVVSSTYGYIIVYLGCSTS